MKSFFAPSRARRLANALMRLWSKQLDERSMLAPAIVFAPHPDDEALGCGATILRKRELGVDVKVVFMTDGTLSPPDIPAHQLKPMREKEGLASCRRLGVEPDNVTFLEFKDGTLAKQIESAADRVAQFLREHPAEQIFVTYHGDVDQAGEHRAAARIVRAAAKRIKRPITLYEYPIWFWFFWPYTRMPDKQHFGAWNTQRRHNLLRNLFALTTFRFHVNIAEVRESKQAAMKLHHSQMEQFYGLRGGQFVKWFIGEREIFCRHKLSGR
jgi:LmbE family N-acetylglucosaminyl deacetylase